jgi:hypothetical protein
VPLFSGRESAINSVIWQHSSQSKDRASFSLKKLVVKKSNNLYLTLEIPFLWVIESYSEGSVEQSIIGSNPTTGTDREESGMNNVAVLVDQCREY